MIGNLTSSAALMTAVSDVAEREAAEMSAIRTFLAEVVDVSDVHPHLRRVVVGGADLTGFVPPAPDTFVYVLLPPPVAVS